VKYLDSRVEQMVALENRHWFDAMETIEMHRSPMVVVTAFESYSVAYCIALDGQWKIEWDRCQNRHSEYYLRRASSGIRIGYWWAVPLVDRSWH